MKLGIIDLPWDSLSDIQAAFASASKRQAAGLNEFLQSYLPSSAMSGLGLFSGVTQKPDWDDDD